MQVEAKAQPQPDPAGRFRSDRYPWSLCQRSHGHWAFILRGTASHRQGSHGAWWEKNVSSQA